MNSLLQEALQYDKSLMISSHYYFEKKVTLPQDKRQFMKELFIPYEQSLQLKELGFDAECIGAFDDEKEFGIIDSSEIETKDFVCKNSWYAKYGICITAPLYQQTFDWFLEKHGLFVETTLWGDGIGFISQIKQIKQKEVYDLGSATPNRGLPNWDKQLEDLACLKKLIEIAQKSLK